jgi:hypothetical protein
MITNLRLNAFEWQLLILSTILICITTRSRGVLISALLSLVVFLMARKDNFSSFKRGLLLFLPVLLLCFYMIAYNSNYLDKWGVFIDTYDQRMDTTNIEDSRINKYIESSTYYIPNFFGRGYTLTMNGENFRPHSDHIRMLYSYGIIAYFAVILFLFNKVFTYKALFMIPALIAFSINSLIDDHKLLGIILVFLAFIISRQKSIISKNIDMKRKELYAATNFI